ncbi:MAG: Flp pilus assembly complex ATPase component TadA [Aphanothece sp. CMT-3BRIN-NPC111]|jgi:type IV pilus assembly protein PilB|nr:Flp pilus assembly complex ATPase component TadA [Aphanothece sp. CMT-3BRIN-NPC111]
MTNSSPPLILSVDDDPTILRVLQRILTNAGYNVITAQSAIKALDILSQTKPDLILLDVMMSGMNGYEFCSKIQQKEELAYIPVIFVTALDSEQHKAKAFAVGGVDYLAKPFENQDLLQKVALHLKTNTRWAQVRQDFVSWDKWSLPENFLKFKQFLVKQINLSSNQQELLLKIRPAKLYSLAEALNLTSSQIAKYVAEFLEVPYIKKIDPEYIKLGLLPPLFCKANVIVPIRSTKGGNAFILSNAFNWELLDLLNRFIERDQQPEIAITEPENILSLFPETTNRQLQDKPIRSQRSNNPIKPPSLVPRQVNPGTNQQTYSGSKYPVYESQPGGEAQKRDSSDRSIEQLVNSILESAVSHRASDLHIEPKAMQAVLRFRIDGDMRNIDSLPKDKAAKAITRLKALGGLEITERRRPQDGAFETTIGDRTFKLRLATTSTPDGESLIIRLLEPASKPKKLNELGMNANQVHILSNFAKQSQGLVLVVGPTGSGKSTTIYSLLSQIDTKSRSLISVEDPVEYRIPDANQQQVNEKARVTFDSLLKSAMRQDPDILFLGEIRDPFSAKVCMDFASTGHLTVSSLHSASATSAIFRLEQLGVNRGTMADALLGIVAQKLLKKLCQHCKQVAPTTEEEAAMLAPFTQEIPSVVAHPTGCPKCNNTGYFGREGVYEILHFDGAITEMVRREVPISVIRGFARQRGDCLIGNHAVEKVKDLMFAPSDVYEKVLLEESRFKTAIPEKNPSPIEGELLAPGEPKTVLPSAVPPAPPHKTSVLVVEEDVRDKELLERWLTSAGYEVVVAKNGVDALFELGKRKFSAIVSNVNMPFLDGQKLLEILAQKAIDTPVIFLTTGRATEIEAKGLDFGAADYIMKPIEKDVLLLRVKNNLNLAHRERAMTPSDFN